MNFLHYIYTQIHSYHMTAAHLYVDSVWKINRIDVYFSNGCGTLLGHVDI